MLRPVYLLVNALILCDFTLLLSHFTNNFNISVWVIVIISIMLSIANRIKMDYRQTGFTPWDFLMFKEAKSMTGALNKKSMLLLIIYAISGAGILLYSSRFITPFHLSNTSIILLSIVTMVLLIFIYIVSPRFNQRLSVFRVGMVYFFIANMHDPAKIKISKESTNNFNINNNNFLDGFSKPEVIVIQSESFVDPLVLGADKFNIDPLPYYRKIKNESITFNMATRAFGGGTVHTEYEILTGLSSIFFPKDTTAFSRYINNALPSLGSILKKHGYNSLLIHPYYEWYYNRTEVYRNLGFDRFSSLKSFNLPNNNYASDKVVYDRILEELNNGTNLVVAVTMQNHTPYNKELYKNDIHYQGSFKDKDTKRHFDNYLNGLNETDKSLEYLIAELNKRENEVILLFYGDHLPVINQDASFYEQSKWSKNQFDSWQYYYDLSKSPGFIWSNKRKISNIKDFNIDATEVLPTLLKEIKLEYPNYLKNLDSILNNEKVNSMFRDFIVKNDKFYGSNHKEYIDLYNRIKDLNVSAFIDQKYDNWRYQSATYKVF